MSAPSFDAVKHNLLDKLKELDPRLTYHSIHHTLDVLKHTERIALNEGIHNTRTLYLLKLAALYHDCGFLFTYTGHEDKSCEIFLTDADQLLLTGDEIDLVTDLIMVTKLTNLPVTHLQKIIRDADVDYLGRPDFFEIAGLLKNELLAYHIVSDEKEWNEQQTTFLKNHHYYTRSSQLLREPVKLANLNLLSS
jgi:uncharacterized protein